MIIIYHKNCSDGFCAAFVAKKKYPDATLFGATYGEPEIPTQTVMGQDVLFVDFSYPRESLIKLSAVTRSLLVLDHHKTAQADLQGLDFAIFDMNRSGAGLTWDFLFGGSRPWYVSYVEDRDLWNWKLPNSKEVSGYIMALPHTIEAWSKLDTMQVTDALAAGGAIRTHVEHYVEKVSEQYQMGGFLDTSIAVVNAAYPNISDVGNELCKVADIGLGYFERKDGKMQFSLRSVGDVDVSVIAKMYGGGGHKNAAGFELDYKAGRAFVDMILGRANNE